MTDRLRRLRPLLPTNPDTMPLEEASPAPPVEESAPLPPRLAARKTETREAAAHAEAPATSAMFADDDEATATATPSGQDPYIAFAQRWG